MNGTARGRRQGARSPSAATAATRSSTADKVLIGIGFGGNSEASGSRQPASRRSAASSRSTTGMKTNVDGVYAIGDVTGKLMLAHVASDQGVIAVEGIAGRDPAKLDYEKMPRCTYCQPQVASVGLTEAQARERGIPGEDGPVPRSAPTARRWQPPTTDGFVKIVADADYGEIAGRPHRSGRR